MPVSCAAGPLRPSHVGILALTAYVPKQMVRVLTVFLCLIGVYIGFMPTNW